VFEPRSNTSRRKVFQNQWAEAFSKAEVVCLAKPFEIHKLSQGEALDVDQVVKDLQAKGVQAASFASADDIVAFLTPQSRKGDLIVMMSNGAFDGIYQKLLNALKSQFASLKS
jgi:UDP-N-acetylmuramate: L-alanyl-gamma-D-glutamyl-meso-diaminopimelate ligase